MKQESRLIHFNISLNKFLSSLKSENLYHIDKTNVNFMLILTDIPLFYCLSEYSKSDIVLTLTVVLFSLKKERKLDL